MKTFTSIDHSLLVSDKSAKKYIIYKNLFINFIKNSVIGCLFFGGGAIYTAFIISDVRLAENTLNMTDEEFIDIFTHDVDSIRSQRQLIAVGSKSLSLKTPNFKIAKRSTEEALAYAQPCPFCELGLIYIDIKKYNTLSNYGIEALRRSYILSPYGEEETLKWRLQVSEIYWNILPDDLKKRALTQITGLAETRSGRLWLKNFSTNVEEINERLSRII